MVDENSMPQIEAPWILAMISCGFVGLTIHIAFITVTTHHYLTDINVDSRKGLVFIIGCILLLCFNMCACLLWAVARTNIIFPLSHTACGYIYASNFLCYFFAKYILHCLLIFRIYMTFKGSAMAMSFRHLVVFICIVSFNFLAAMCVWTMSIAPNVLQGQWTVNDTNYQICTLFSAEAHQNISVQLSAITVGVEDFIVGTITLVVFLRRFRQIARDAQDIQLFEASTRFGVASFFSVISTLFLFTFAIPFYPNMTFVLAIDATINSLCLFCVLSVGQDLYYYVCAPCRVAGNRWFDLRKMHPDLTASQLAGYFMSSSQQDLRAGMDPSSKMSQLTITTPGGKNTAVLDPLDEARDEMNDTPVSIPPRRSALGLDPIASSLLIKTNSLSSKHVRLISRQIVDEESEPRMPRPMLPRKSESEPVPQIENKKPPIQLKNNVSLFG
eukprot:496237_1